MLSSESAGKSQDSTGLKACCFFLIISSTAHSGQPSHRAQSLCYEVMTGHGDWITPVQPQDCLFSGAGSTWARGDQ